MVDSGATSSLMQSLFNMTKVTIKDIKIHLAGQGMAMKLTHSTRHIQSCMTDFTGPGDNSPNQDKGTLLNNITS
jgi:hypothetical protein